MAVDGLALPNGVTRGNDPDELSNDSYYLTCREVPYRQDEPIPEEEELNNSLMNESMIEDVIVNNPDLEEPVAGGEEGGDSAPGSSTPLKRGSSTLQRSESSVPGIAFYAALMSF